MVLINSGSIPNDADFRKTLAEVLHKISTYQVTGIGVDLIFEKHKDSNDVFLKNELINNPKIVLAQDIKGSKNQIFNSQNDLNVVGTLLANKNSDVITFKLRLPRIYKR